MEPGAYDPEVLSIWTVYDHPDDYPEHFAARRWAWDKPTEDVLLFDSLEALQARFWMLHWMPRSPQDEAQILGCYL